MQYNNLSKYSYFNLLLLDKSLNNFHFSFFLVYGPWTPWTPCSKFCGIGIKQRNRSCIPAGSSCGNYRQEQRACGVANCQRVAGNIRKKNRTQFYLTFSCRH